MADDDVQVVEDSKDEVTDLAKTGNESPVIRFVNYLIFDAIKQGASDIHIEPKEKELKIRYRIDGILFEAMNPPHSMHAAIVSRLKIMANLDISERRLPQDGRIRAIVHGRKVDLRLSTLPTAYGEKCVMRILDNRSINVALEDLGFGEDALTIWKNQIDQPHGILLVTGPTGSGKTTTLYSSLRCMDGNKLNISTVEDPIEYHLAQANQVQVHDKIGMTFSAALRSLLRQDPDVVMLGEIRDARRPASPCRRRSPATWCSAPCTPTTPRVDHAADQHRRRAVPDQRGGQRDPGPAAGPQDLPALPRGIHAQRRDAGVPHASGLRVEQTASRARDATAAARPATPAGWASTNCW